jgi:hypothetical protein
MKISVSLAALAILGLSVAGCQSFGTVATQSNNIAAAAPSVCADLQAAGALTSAVAAQIAAANPHNAKVLAATSKVQTGAALSATDCTVLASVVQIGNVAVQAGAVAGSTIAAPAK